MFKYSNPELTNETSVALRSTPAGVKPVAAIAALAESSES